MIERLESLLTPIVAEQSAAMERQIYLKQAEIETDLAGVGRIGGGVHSWQVTDACREGIQQFSDELVSRLQNTAANLGLARGEPLESELHRLFDLWFQPFQSTITQHLGGRFRGLRAAEVLRPEAIAAAARAHLSIFSFSPLDAGPDIDLDRYIADLELSLRSLVRGVLRFEHEADWLDQVAAAMGEEAFAGASERMRQRRVDGTDDFLHYTNLVDLKKIIGDNWNSFREFIDLRRNEFNQRMDVVVRARTEVAHHRPGHLFPPIERSRAKVAAYDVLASLKEAPPRPPASPATPE